MQIVSHRFRGFGPFENSLQNLRNAIIKGIQSVEFDVRFTADNIPVIFHDTLLTVSDTKLRTHLASSSFKEINDELKLSGSQFRLSEMSELCEIASGTANLQLWLDVKETGGEELLYALLQKYNLTSQTIIVSWLPEVLRKFYQFDDNLQLCFSHYPLSTFGLPFSQFLKPILQTGKKISTLFSATGEAVICVDKFNTDCVQQIRGIDYEHVLTTPVNGELLDLLKNTRGYVCIRKELLTKSLREYYKNNGIKVVLYSVTSDAQLKYLYEKFTPDGVLSDSAAISLLHSFGN